VKQSAKVDLLSIFFPMWNEEDYVERAVRAAEEECQRLIDIGEISAYELLIVDDCSTDRTPEIADALAAADPRIRVVHHPVNRGLGGSIKTGFTSARGDVVLYTDADLPFEMLELGRALRVLRHYEADMVSAYRLDRTGEGPRPPSTPSPTTRWCRWPSARGCGTSTSRSSWSAGTCSRPPGRSARGRSSTPSW